MPLVPIPLPHNCPNAIYIERFKTHGFDTVIFGDLYLEDIRRFREQSFPDTELIFPLWHRNTADLAREMIAGGLLAHVTAATNPALIGRNYNLDFLHDLSPTTDPCGENGEFHTWVHPQCLGSFR